MRRQLLVLIGTTTALVLAALLVPLALLVRSHAEDRAMTDATERGQSVAAVVGGSLAAPGGGNGAGAGGGAGDGNGPGGNGPGRGSGSAAGQEDGSGSDGTGADGTGVRTDLVRGVLDSLNGDDQPHTSVVLPDGRTLGRHTGWVGEDALRLARHGRAFTYAAPDGGRVVMVPVMGSGATAGAAGREDATVVEVAVTEDQLRAGVLPSWLAVTGLGVALVLLGLALADRLAARLVRSTRRLAGVADRLGRGDLAARAEPSGPAELRLVAGRLNELGERIGLLVTAERERAADLAHRLRTPVAALRLDAEGLRDGEEAARIGAGVTALERSVDEVIRAARRAGAAAAGTDGARADLAAVARERTDFWAPLAEDQDRTVTLDVPADGRPVPVRVPPDDLCAVLDTLIGNVLDHTPEGTGLWVTVTGDGVLTVEDDGPGFPGTEVGARGSSGAGSTGLGLDIARATAELSGGGVELGRGRTGAGARVSCRFGLTDEDVAPPRPVRR